MARRPSYQWMIERIAVDHTFPNHLERWKQLWSKEKWNLTVLLVEPERKECVTFGCKPAANRSGPKVRRR